MSYGRMERKAAKLAKEVKGLLKQAENNDVEEDRQYGKGKRGDELPEDLRFKQSRLKRIRQAKQALEQEARREAQGKQAEYEAKMKVREKEPKKTSPKPKPPSDKPGPKKQRNFTDPDSRIMATERKKNFIQGYNCQAAVDEKSQVIVSSLVTQSANDKQELQPVLEKLTENLPGKKPKRISADNGYYSDDNCTYLASENIDAYIATGKDKHSEKVQAARGRIP